MLFGKHAVFASIIPLVFSLVFAALCCASWIRLGKDAGVKGWESVKHTEFDSSSLLAAYDIEYLTTSSEPKYRYRMTYTFDDTHGEQIITVAVNFDEICPTLRHKMMTEWKKEKISRVKYIKYYQM